MEKVAVVERWPLWGCGQCGELAVSGEVAVSREVAIVERWVSWRGGP